MTGVEMPMLSSVGKYYKKILHRDYFLKSASKLAVLFCFLNLKNHTSNVTAYKFIENKVHKFRIKN